MQLRYQCRMVRRRCVPLYKVSLVPTLTPSPSNMLSMSSGIGFRSLFSSKSASSGANTLIDVLDNAQAALKESKDLLNLAPVSGLSTAVGVLLAIIDQVKVCTRYAMCGPLCC